MKPSNNNNNGKDPFANLRTMTNEGMRFLKDIASRRCNVYSDPRSAYFRNLTFTNAVLTEIRSKVAEYECMMNALNYTYGTQPLDSVQTRVFISTRKSLEAYRIIKEALENIMLSNGNPAFLFILQNRLPTEFRGCL